jgi:hypothetical protein
MNPRCEDCGKERRYCKCSGVLNWSDSGKETDLFEEPSFGGTLQLPEDNL